MYDVPMYIVILKISFYRYAFVTVLVKKYHVLNCTLICIKALVQSTNNCIQAACNIKHNNTLLFGLMLSAQVKQFQSCRCGFLGIPSTSSNEEEMSCSRTQYRVRDEIQTHNLAIKSQ